MNSPLKPLCVFEAQATIPRKESMYHIQSWLDWEMLAP